MKLGGKFGLCVLAASPLVLDSCLGPTSPYQGGSYVEDNEMAAALSVSGGTYTLQDVNAGKCADLSGDKTVSGSQIVQWTCNGSTSQKWKLNDLGSGLFTVVSASSNKCLDLAASSAADGAKIEQWTCSGAVNQKWKFVAAGSGYEIVSASSAKCADVSGNSTADGAKINQWTCKGSTNQQFKLVSAASTTPPPTTAKKNAVGYLPDWNGDYSTWAGKLNWGSLTHVNLCFGNPNSSGVTTLAQSASNINTLVSTAHGKGVKVLVSIGGASGLGDVSKWLGSSRSTYVSNLASFVNTYHLDGVDVDLEGPDVNSNYGALVTDLVNKFHPGGKLVTAAVAQWFAASIPSSALQAFDFVNVMAYDDCGDWTGACEQSTYASAQKSLDYFSGRGVSNGRLVLGLPFYGWCWGSGCGESNWSYAKILSKFSTANQKDWYTASGITLSYNGRPTIQKKAALARSYGGVMAWELTGDAAGGASLMGLAASTLWAP
jgi:GH18 family chitinase